MDGSSIDHYEEQLYSMFKSFDVNNEETLGESAVHALCAALQLEERGAALADALFQPRGARVSFQRFRSGLLAVLGDAAPAPPLPDPPDPPPEPDLPGLSFGSKRYGRRSRPALPEPRAASASRADPPGDPASRAPRSASATPADALDPHVRIDNAAALRLCRDLRMDALDTRIVERIFEDSPTRDATLGEFFEQLDSTLARTVSELGEDDPPDRLLDEWERAGVRRPRRLLAELGFAEKGALDPAAVERALDAELRERAAGDGDAERGRLLTAALALSRARVRAARRLAEAAAGERDKLRADVVEANARAALLVREVDEQHARIEREAAESVRRASARHAEELRRARADADAEAERGLGERVRLQAEVARRKDVEARLRAELAAGAACVSALEGALSGATTADAAARAECARLAEQLAAAEAAGAAAGARESEARAALVEARERARQMGARAEELAAALEGAQCPPRAPSPCASPPPRAGAALSVELGALLTPDSYSEKGDPDDGSSSLKAGAPEPTDNLDMIEAQSKHALPLLAEEKEETTPTNMVESASSEAVETISTASVEAAAQTEAMDGAEECDRLRELVKELEAALDAMRAEYDACEDYWSGKQAAERAAHHMELRAADSRLAALLAQVAAFERRLPPPAPALPTIPEAPALEAQVCALQEESAAAVRAAAALQEQLARARRRLHAALRRRDAPAPPPPAAPPAPCARCRPLEAMGARALRAEVAARRLEARLLAADVLVKELFVENCHLARGAPSALT